MGDPGMSAPPPYQNQPPHQQYGYAQPVQPPVQQPYGQQPYGQQPYGHPQPPGGPQRPPQRSPLRGLITAVVILAIFGGGAWYVWDYNTNPNGGKAKEEADRVARREAADKKYNPKIGDCVKIKDPQGEPVTLIVDCGSADAEYKLGERLDGPAQKCGPKWDYGIEYVGRHTASYTLCFSKV
ncbi:LppU/SCO3897 family protein [Streptomyces sp. NRRL S-1448]|uniref:LppU/SCO3897 family protein n=2 Tax=unclassified Streptomyces TaxID=2593676 RepID=UPI001F2E27DC|nr:hypothetical protein [Streptomyces sp. NRRL S-1448]